MYLYMCITHVKDKLLIEKIHRRFTRMIPELKLVPYGDKLTKYGHSKIKKSELT